MRHRFKVKAARGFQIPYWPRIQGKRKHRTPSKNRQLSRFKLGIHVKWFPSGNLQSIRYRQAQNSIQKQAEDLK
jgi:hypothetical protein